MTIEEIFNHISNHMIEGTMIHFQLSQFFGFLGLKGYEKCHEYRYFEESKGLIDITHYFLHHCNQLIEETPLANPNIIPNNWLKYKRQEVSTETRRAAIQTGFEKWVEWERNTKNLFISLHKELINLNKIEVAIKLEEYIKDVDKELAAAEQYVLELQATDYDMVEIMSQQECIYKKYKNKLKETHLC